MGFVLASILFWNVLLLLNLASSRRLRENNITPFVISMSVADVGIGLFVVSISVAFALGPLMPEPGVNCTACFVLQSIQAFCVNFFSATSLYSMAAMCSVKYVAIVKPFHYLAWFTTRRCYVIVCLLWTACLAFTLPAPLTASSIYITCVFMTYSLIGRTYYFVLQGLVYMPSFGLIIAIQVRIFAVIFRQTQRIAAETRGLQGLSVPYAVVAKSLRSARNLLVVSSAFFVTYVPSIMAGIAAVANMIVMDSRIAYALLWMYLCNSFLNSLLYIMLHQSIRSVTLKISLKLCCISWPSQDQEHATEHVPTSVQLPLYSVNRVMPTVM
jgi:hypothetical protein